MNIRKINIKVISFLFFFTLLFPSSKIFAFHYKEWDINIHGSINEMYDDNLTFAKDDKKADFITSLALNLNIVRQWKRQTLKFTGRINERFNMRFKDIKTSSQSLAFHFLNEFSKYDRIEIADTFSHSQFPESFEEEFGRVRSRRESYSHSLNLNYAKDISEHLRMKALYNFSENLFPEKGVGGYSSQHGIGFNVAYLPNLTTEYSLSYAFSKSNFGISTYNTNIGITKYLYISKKTFLAGKVGFSGSESNNIRLIVNTSFTNEIDKKTFTSISFNMSDQLTSEGEDIFRSWQVNGQLSRQFSPRSNGSFSAFYGQGAFSLTGITDILLGINLALTYEFWEDLSGNLIYSYSNYDSSDENRSYDRNTISLGITKTF